MIGRKKRSRAGAWQRSRAGAWQRSSAGAWQRPAMVLLSGMALIGITGCSHVMMMLHGTDVERPAETEFGLGPRASANALFTGTLEPESPLRPRRMFAVRAVILNAAGQPVDGAEISVDGGMPEHDHGLPTQPRVTKQLGDGRYEIEGVRFNMGGWWEFKLAVSTAAGTDTLTFNLDL